MITVKTNKWVARIPAVVMAGFVVAISFALSKMTWFVLDDGGPINTIVSSVVHLPAGDKVKQSRYGADIAAWNLLGVPARVSTSSKVTVPSVAPKTRLQLVLEGVYIAPNKRESSAIIANRGSAKRYLLGNKVPGGVTLYQVEQKHVILKKTNGRFETLYFSDKNLSSSRVSKTTRNRSSKQFNSGRRQGKRGIVSDIRRGRIKSVKDVMENYGANPAEQFAAVLLEAGMVDADDGEPGLKVGKNAPSDILKAIGLRRGDIVRSINNFPVNELQGNDDVLQEILHSRQAKIVIQRGKRRFTVNYPLPQG